MQTNWWIIAAVTVASASLRDLDRWLGILRPTPYIDTVILELVVAAVLLWIGARRFHTPSPATSPD